MLQVQKVPSHLKKSLPLAVGLCAYVQGRRWKVVQVSWIDIEYVGISKKAINQSTKIRKYVFALKMAQKKVFFLFSFALTCVPYSHPPSCKLRKCGTRPFLVLHPRLIHFWDTFTDIAKIFTKVKLTSNGVANALF